MGAKHVARWHTCQEKPHVWGQRNRLPHPPEARAEAATLEALRRLVPLGVIAFVNWEDPGRRQQIRADGSIDDHRHRGKALVARREFEAQRALPEGAEVFSRGPACWFYRLSRGAEEVGSFRSELVACAMAREEAGEE